MREIAYSIVRNKDRLELASADWFFRSNAIMTAYIPGRKLAALLPGKIASSIIELAYPKGNPDTYWC
jgi:hypothetical protein